jgi:glycosyltransferase family protein
MMKIRTILGVIHSELLHVVELVQFKHSKVIQQFIRNIKIMNTEETVNYILQHRCSVSRFGDGEFFVMDGGGNGFQHPDERLRQRLIDVFQTRDERLLVCIPYTWKSQENLKHTVKVFYTRFLLRNNSYIFKWLDYQYVYGDTLFSRFYMDYKDKSLSRQRINLIKKLWRDRDVYIIEGELTRMGVGNDLFEGAKSIHRILCPSKSAFDRYDEILKTAKEVIPQDGNALILLALGMTATVLASDLSRAGYQAIDIGHLDVEYEWMRMGAKKKVPIPTRFVNEANNYDEVRDCRDEEYQQQIIAEIK